MQGNNEIVIKLKEGSKEKEYKLKCKFFSDETQKEYWIYTDDLEDKDGNIELKVSYIETKDDKISLVSCTDNAELNLVVNMYDALKHHVNIKNDGEKHENKKI
jgi:uncharacterized protein YrzB (UPF0473 family)